MVPDDGWQERKKYDYIYQSRFKLNPVSKALREDGVDLGIWVAMDGTTSALKPGQKLGYKLAVEPLSESYKKKKSYWGPQRYFNILDSKYQQDYKKALKR